MYAKGFSLLCFGGILTSFNGIFLLIGILYQLKLLGILSDGWGVVCSSLRRAFLRF